MVTPENGLSVCLSVMVWPAAVPVIVGASLTDVATTVVDASVTGQQRHHRRRR
jgi:hypothetical protein